MAIDNLVEITFVDRRPSVLSLRTARITSKSLKKETFRMYVLPRNGTSHYDLTCYYPIYYIYYYDDVYYYYWTALISLRSRTGNKRSPSNAPLENVPFMHTQPTITIRLVHSRTRGTLYILLVHSTISSQKQRNCVRTSKKLMSSRNVRLTRMLLMYSFILTNTSSNVRLRILKRTVPFSRSGTF
jgi:restriction endonuclease S subunit